MNDEEWFEGDPYTANNPTSPEDSDEEFLDRVLYPRNNLVFSVEPEPDENDQYLGLE